MKKIIVLFIILFGVAFAIKFSDQINLNLNLNNKTPEVKIKSKTFKVISAKTLKEKQIGLSSKTSLDKNSGMLFAFDKADYYPFWMKDMKFPIDIIFIKGDKIVTLYKNVKPPKSGENPEIIKPESPADKVFEINAGLSDQNKIGKGDQVVFKNL